MDHDAVSRLLDNIRLAEKMADSIQQLSSLNGAPNKSTLIAWSVRAKAALRDAREIAEAELHKAHEGEEPTG